MSHSVKRMNTSFLCSFVTCCWGQNVLLVPEDSITILWCWRRPFTMNVWRAGAFCGFLLSVLGVSNVLWGLLVLCKNLESCKAHRLKPSIWREHVWTQALTCSQSSFKREDCFSLRRCATKLQRITEVFGNCSSFQHDDSDGFRPAPVFGWYKRPVNTVIRDKSRMGAQKTRGDALTASQLARGSIYTRRYQLNAVATKWVGMRVTNNELSHS